MKWLYSHIYVLICFKHEYSASSFDEKIEFPYSITCSFVYMYKFYLLHRTLCLRCAERKKISHFKIIIDMPHRSLMHEIGTYRNCFIFGDINHMKM